MTFIPGFPDPSSRQGNEAVFDERIFPALFESFPEAVCLVEPGGRILCANRPSEKMFGYRRTELLGRRIDELLPGPAGRFRPPGFGATTAEPMARAAGTRHVAARHRDGHELQVEVTFSPIQARRGTLVLTFVRDVTERETKENDDALQASEERYRTLFENANDIIYSHDMDGRMTSFNRAGELTTGFSREEILGRSYLRLLAPDFAEVARDLMTRVLPERELVTTEFDILTKDGRRVPVEASVRLLRQQGKPVGVEGIARDVSARRELEEQLRHAQKMEAVGQLAGGVAHDFNNLLTAILGYTELLMTRLGDDDPSRKETGEIRHAALRAAALTRQLLAFSRRQVLNVRDLDLNAVVEETEALLRRLIGEHIDLVRTCRRDLPMIRADPIRLEQVLINLVVNGRDAMPRGGQLAIETGEAEMEAGEVAGAPPGRYVVLRVTDTGVGMDPETRSRIFEPFFTTKELGKGTGLGLSTVYGIVEQSGWFIRVDSELDRGTTFRIYFPTVDSGGEERIERSVGTGALDGSETILVVEDEEAVRQLICRIFRDRGYAVLEAGNGREALGLARRHPEGIDLLLTDVVMPEMGGQEVAERLLSERPGLKVVYMSGYAEHIVSQHGVVGVPGSLLRKPFSSREALRQVRRELDA